MTIPDKVIWRVGKEGMNTEFVLLGLHDKQGATRWFRDRHKLKNMRGITAIQCTCDAHECSDFAVAMQGVISSGVFSGFRGSGFAHEHDRDECGLHGEELHYFRHLRPPFPGPRDHPPPPG